MLSTVNVNNVFIRAGTNMQNASANSDMYTNILVAVDFSDSSKLAMKKAVEMSEKCKARLELIHVVDVPVFPVLEDVAVMGMPGLWDESLAESLITASDKKLKQLAEEFSLDNYSTIVGTPSLDIVERAKQKKQDLIIIGIHGTSGIKKLIGSTANSVINNAPCDVLSVKLND